MIWNWGKKKTKSTAKGPTVESTLNDSGESLINMLNDWKSEQVKGPKKLELSYNERLSMRRELEKQRELNALNSVNATNSAFSSTASPTTVTPAPHAPNSTDLMTGMTPPKAIVTPPKNSVYSANTEKYHQIIDCLDEYQDELESMMSELKQRPNLQQNKSFSDSGSTASSTFSYSRKFDTPDSEYTPISACVSQEEKHEKHEPLENPFTMQPRVNNESLPWSVKEKTHLINDLGIPRSYRGSILPTEGSDYNELAQQYFGKKTRRENKNINREAFKRELSKEPFEGDSFFEKKHSMEKKPSLEKHSIEKQTSNKKPVERKPFEKKSFDKPFEKKLPSQPNYLGKPFQATGSSKQGPPQILVKQGPKENSPFFRRQEAPASSALVSSNAPVNSGQNKLVSPFYRKQPDPPSPELSLDSNSNRSSINSQITSLESPVSPKPDYASYIHNHNPSKVKSFKGRDRMKLNRASSVYTNEPVNDFKNIDMGENPLPQIGNLLSSNLDFDMSNPYADLEAKTSYSSFSNPYDNL